uniref:Decapping nuclease n=1 Tax=Panagrolaimus superbus TaxID=310955 RepID=A0A914YVF3_9BILA
MATIINKQSGILLQKPFRYTFTSTSLKTELINTFFIGRNFPINYSPKLRKRLKEEYDIEDNDVEIDLNAGNNELIDNPRTLSFDLLLDYLIDQRKRSKKDLEKIVHGASIVCRRGVLIKLINAIYYEKGEFIFAVKKFRGIYFIKEISTVTYQKSNVRRAGDPHTLLPKFKNLIIDPFDDASYVPPKENSTWEQMQGLYLCNLSLINSGDSKTLKIFYGTEIDAFDTEDNAIGIKLQRGDFNNDKSLNTPFMIDKIRKWFFQSHFVNSDTVIVGFHEDKVVNLIKKFNIDSLPSMFYPENQWNSNYSSTVTILTNVFEFYENNVSEDETLMVELLPKDTNILYHVRDDTIHNVLPREFKEAFEEIIVTLDNVNAETAKSNGPKLQTENAWLDNIIENALNV